MIIKLLIYINKINKLPGVYNIKKKQNNIDIIIKELILVSKLFE
jgi:hypothetical protein